MLRYRDNQKCVDTHNSITSC